MVTASLQTQFRKLGRRLVLIGVTSGVGWGVTTAVLLLLMGVWMDLLWELPPALRIGSGVIALLVGSFVLGMMGRRALGQRAPRILARRLDLVGATGGQILSGVDLLLEKPSQPPLSAGLAALAVERASQLASGVAGARAVPAQPVGRSFGSLGLLLFALVIGGLCLPRLAWTQWLRFTDPFGDHPPYSRVLYQVKPGNVRILYGNGLDVRVTTEGAAVERLHLVLQNPDGTGEESLPMFPEADGGWRATVANITTHGRYFVRSHAGRSHRFAIDVITVPQLESVRFRITPPAYTNRPPYEGSLPQGGLAGLPGTRVQVMVKSNRPLSGGSLVLPGPVTVALTPTARDSPEANSAFEIRKSGKLQLQIIDLEGQPSTETYAAAISVLTDERPFIRILEPPALSLATPEVTLPVTLAAEDDYGITRIELFRSLNDSRALSMPLTLPNLAPIRWHETIQLPLSTYGLEPGDEIKLYARVEDNDPAGPKGSESAVAVVRIISQSDFERLVRARKGLELLQSKYRQAQRRMEALANDTDRLRKKAKEQKPQIEEARKLREELRQLAEKMRAEAEAIRKASQQKLGYDLDQHLTPQLERLSRQLEKTAKDMEALARESKLTPEELAQALEKLREQLDQEQQQLAREALEPLEHLGLIQPLIEDAARFVILYQRQRSLAERLQSLKDKERSDDPALKNRMRDLQEEQQEIHTSLSRLLEQIEDHVAKLPEDPKLDELRKSALEFVDAVRNSGAAEAMNEAEAGLAEFSGKRSEAGAQKAADILEKFLTRCEQGMAGKGRICLRFQPGLADGLGNTVEQLLGDAGLLPGNHPGSGMGQGNGQSMSRNTLDNVGLYGGLPALGEPTQSGSASGNRTGSWGGMRSGNDAAHPGSGAASQARGGAGSEASVPGLYRRRVAEYFQRIADETGSK